MKTIYYTLYTTTNSNRSKCILGGG